MKTVWSITHVKTTRSTNLLAKSGSPGDVFTADRQTEGRGRLDHRWLSAAGQNLMMSAVVDISGMEAQDAATLPLVAGLAVVEALGSFARGLALKWPNDVLAGGRKLSGILCERSGDIAVVGIGVNVRQKVFPDEIARRATSLALLGSGAAVSDVRDAVLDSLGLLLDEWRRGGFAALWPRARSVDCLAGRRVAVRQQDSDSSPVSGPCGGIARDGSLLVAGRRLWAGEAHVLSVSDVQLNF